MSGTNSATTPRPFDFVDKLYDEDRDEIESLRKINGQMLSALKADSALLMKLAPLVFKAEIAEHLPFGLKEEVEEWLKQSQSQAAISKAEEGKS